MFFTFDNDVQKILIYSKKEMKELRSSSIRLEHLFLSFLKNYDLLFPLFKKYNFSYENVKNYLLDICNYEDYNDWIIYSPSVESLFNYTYKYCREMRINEVNSCILFNCLLSSNDYVINKIFDYFDVNIDSFIYDFSENYSNINSSLKYLSEFGINICDKARNNKLISIYGRDMEIDRIISILERKNKNNPLLLGEAGVGKTAIVEELALRIVNGNVPLDLINCEIYLIPMASLIAGTKYRGEFEERVNNILNEVQDNNNIIIFIDEIHTIMGAGGAEGAIDISNILKPALARGDIRVIGATTEVEYNKYMSNDKAIDRRFQKIYIREPNNIETYEILKKIKSSYEKYHNIIISDECIKYIVDYSSKYYVNKRQPDKAIDLFDEVCSKKRIKDSLICNNLLKNINDAVLNNNYKLALKLNNENIDMKHKLSERMLITKDDIDETIEAINNNFKKNEILVLENKLKSCFYDNDSVINEFVSGVRNKYLGYSFNNKPLSFLFCGKNGTGKKYLSLKISEFLFNDKKIYIDLNDYSDYSSITKLFGYELYNSGNMFSKSIFDSVLNDSFSIIILDNFFNSNKQVRAMFYRIFESGVLELYDGRIIDFRSCIFIGISDAINSSVGFLNNSNYYSKFSYVLKFNSVNRSTIRHIIKNKLNDVSRELLSRSINFSYNNNLINKIVDNINYDKDGLSNVDCVIENVVNNYIFNN